MTLENLVRTGKLAPHEPSREEIARLLAAVKRNLKDARNEDISPGRDSISCTRRQRSRR